MSRLVNSLIWFLAIAVIIPLAVPPGVVRAEQTGVELSANATVEAQINQDDGTAATRQSRWQHLVLAIRQRITMVRQGMHERIVQLRLKYNRTKQTVKEEAKEVVKKENPPADNPDQPTNETGAAMMLKLITLEDNNSTLALQVGQRFALQLGPMFDWNITADGDAIARVEKLPLNRGLQAVFVASHEGEAKLTAVGDPQCLKQNPACAMASIQFVLNVKVTAKTTEPRPVVCTKEYRPVCGLVVVQCIKAPCPPLRQTFGNRCMAKAAGATVITEGACPKDKVRVDVDAGVEVMVR